MKNTWNFVEDLTDEIKDQYAYLELKFPKGREISDLLLGFLTISRKLIKTKKRKLLINPDLIPKIQSSKYNKTIVELSHRLEKGKNVNLFQSKKIFESEFHDHLVNEWNIHHFHLSMQKEKNSNFRKRTNSLLFTYINDEIAILLDIEKHKEGIFASTKWFEIIDKHFPKVLEEFIYTDDSIATSKLSDIDRQMFWNKGYSLTTTVINDKVYSSPGVGRTGSGHGLITVKTRNEILRWIYEVDKSLINFYDFICFDFKLLIIRPQFRLRISDKLEIYEAISNKTILRFPNIFMI